MTSITRTALCRNEFCPEPRNPDWHECVVCGNPEVEHAHIVARSRAPSRRKDKNNVVALCHAHHELQTLNKWAFHEEPLPFGGLVHQWLTDDRGATVWKRDVRGPSAAAEDVHAGAASSAVAPGASSATDEEGGRPGQESRGVSTVPSSVAPGAGADSREPPSYPAAVTRSSAPEPSLGGDGAIVEPPNLQELPSPPISESLKPNGLDLPPEFTFEEWTSLMDMIEGMDENSPWWWGDAINKGERFGERCWQNIKTRRRSYETLMNYRRVAEAIPRPLRRGNLSFSLHAVFYAQENIGEWLGKCEAGEWTVKQAREAVHGVKPKTVRYTISGLREDLAAWPGEPSLHNRARRWAEAWLDSLEAS